MLYTALASSASVAGTASWTMAFEGFTSESRDSFEAELGCFMLFTKYTVQQDVQLPVTPFFMFF